MKENDTAVFSLYTWYSCGDKDTLNHVFLHIGWATGCLTGTGKASSHSPLKDQKNSTVAILKSEKKKNANTCWIFQIKGMEKKNQIKIYSEKQMVIYNNQNTWSTILTLFSLFQWLLLYWNMVFRHSKLSPKLKWSKINSLSQHDNRHLIICPAAWTHHQDLDLARTYKHPEAISLSKCSHDSLEI